MVQVIAPNLKRRLSGVTTTVLRLVPIQARMIQIVTTGPGLPDSLPHIPLASCFWLKRECWRVWHARRNTEMVLGLLLTRVFRRRLRLLFTSAAQRRHKPFTRWLIRQMDRVVATSARAAAYLEVPHQVVMHGVDCETFHPADKGPLRKALGLDEDALLVGCFGRVRAQKGVDLLVEAALALAPKHPRLQVIFTGRVTDDQKEFHAGLMARIRAAGLESRIRFLGELPWEEVVRHYQALDLFTAPARWEGFGLTPLEAMACGVPVIATKVGAFESLIPEDCGSLIETSSEALQAALDRWLSDPTALAEAGLRARAHVLAHHRIEDEAAALVQIYREMLA